jgi:hypothetical protein
MKSFWKFKFIEENSSHFEMEILGCDRRQQEQSLSDDAQQDLSMVTHGSPLDMQRLLNKTNELISLLATRLSFLKHVI